MTLLDLLARDDLDIAACTVVGLLCYRIAELVDCLLRRDLNAVQRVELQIFVMPCMNGSLPPPSGQ